MANGNLKLAVQKKGRLTEKTMRLLRNCGLDIDDYSERLLISARNFNLDLLFVRDDDIPEYVQDGVADIGIVGENVLLEKKATVKIRKKLGFGKCKLMIGIPENVELEEARDLEGKRIATSYPNILKQFLWDNGISARIIQISGSVEIAPSLGMADYICDIVSTGNTLKLNKLKKFIPIFESQAVLIGHKNIRDERKIKLLADLNSRIDSALIAKKSNYIMMNIPKEQLNEVTEILPALSSPTVLPLADNTMVAVHAVIPTDTFWEIKRELQFAGATGILLLPINNMII